MHIMIVGDDEFHRWAVKTFPTVTANAIRPDAQNKGVQNGLAILTNRIESVNFLTAGGILIPTVHVEQVDDPAHWFDDRLRVCVVLRQYVFENRQDGRELVYYGTFEECVRADTYKSKYWCGLQSPSEVETPC